MQSLFSGGGGDKICLFIRQNFGEHAYVVLEHSPRFNNVGECGVAQNKIFPVRAAFLAISIMYILRVLGKYYMQEFIKIIQG